MSGTCSRRRCLCGLLLAITTSLCRAFISPNTLMHKRTSKNREIVDGRSKSNGGNDKIEFLSQSSVDRTRTQLFSTSTGAATSSNLSTVPSRKPSFDHYDSVICGGGPAGLLSAIMLTQKYPDFRIAVCEQCPTVPPSPSDETFWDDIARFYLLGLGHRGQAALQKFGVFDDFLKASVENTGRRDWQPGQTKVEDGRTTISDKDPPSRILARDKLVGMLHEHLVKNYIKNNDKNRQIDLLYGFQAHPSLSGMNRGDSEKEKSVELIVSKCADLLDSPTTPLSDRDGDEDKLCDVDNEDDETTTFSITTDFLLGADGAARTVAAAMASADKERYARSKNPFRRLFSMRPLRITSFEDDNPRVYKSVPILLPADWPQGLNYSARSRNSRITLEALPSDNNGNLCALLLMKPDDELAQANTEPKLLRQLFNEEFPQFGALVDDEEMARVAVKPASKLPVFRYFGPRLHFGERTMVLGDAAHTVKPYYGLGANTALEDVQVLSDLLDEYKGHVPSTVRAFTQKRAKDSEALVTISRNMDRPGKMFIINFLVPIILDGIFHKLAPKIFGPNMFGMFQKKGIGFRQIRRKKRLDRAGQIACLATLLSGAGIGIHSLVRATAIATGQNKYVVGSGMFIATATAALIRNQLSKRAATSTA